MVFSLSLYLLSLISFIFVKSSVGYCMLLVLSVVCCFIKIFLWGSFVWYSLLMYLVYVGGVYMLFLFMSIHLPNNLSGGIVFNPVTLVMFFLVSWEVVNSNFNTFLEEDLSFNFCSGLEGFTYLYFCLFLLVGFFLVSFISSSKESFIR